MLVRCAVRAIRPARLIVARPASRLFATESKKTEVKRAAPAAAAAAPSQGAPTASKLTAKQTQAQADEKKKSATTLAALRAAVPERKPNPNALFDPPYPRNPLGEEGLPAIQLFKDVKAAGIDPQEVSKQLDAFQHAMDTDTDLSHMIRTPAGGEQTKKPAGASESSFPFMQGRPAIPPPSTTKVSGLTATKAQRDAKFQQVFKQLNLSKPVQTFITHLVSQKGALLELKRLQALFDELARYERNEVLVRVKSAEPLSKDQSKKLRAKLGASAAAGQKLVFVEEVDPKLLGGLVVFFGNKMQDLSSLTKVRNLQKLLQTQAA